jgi:hypothetical protein
MAPVQFMEDEPPLVAISNKYLMKLFRNENGKGPNTQIEMLVMTTTTEDMMSKREIIRRAFEENMKNRPVKHDDGHVLLLSWAELLDDLEVKSEV